MAKLEELEEIDISGNKLKAIPTTIMNCRRMHTVIAHSNCIEVFPEVMQLSEIKVRNECALEEASIMQLYQFYSPLRSLIATGLYILRNYGDLTAAFSSEVICKIFTPVLLQGGMEEEPQNLIFVLTFTRSYLLCQISVNCLPVTVCYDRT